MVAAELSTRGIQVSSPLRPGGVRLLPEGTANHPRVAFAASVEENRSSIDIIEEIGRRLGEITRENERIKTVSAPLLGTGAGGLTYSTAASRLAAGFFTAADERAILVVSVRDPEILRVVSQALTASNRTVTHDAVRGFMEFQAERTESSTERAAVASSSGVPSKTAGKRDKVFISYSHKDREWLTRLRPHLRPLERDGALVWDDSRIQAGMPWKAEVEAALNSTKVAILLISADFLASDFIVDNELPPLLEAAKHDGATILSVIVRPCRFTKNEELSRFQAINDPTEPLVGMRAARREDMFVKVADAVEKALGS
jgi:hypothetical protein